MAPVDYHNQAMKETVVLTRFQRWVQWWTESGTPDDKGPRRPPNISAYNDRELRRAAEIVASVMRRHDTERGGKPLDN